MLRILVALLVLTAAAVGQSDAPELTLRSNARLVQVSVIAQDKQGHPVLDLKREDFRLFDDKKPRDIRVFSIDRVQAATATLATNGGTFSNTADERSSNAGITVIVLDSINTKWTDQSQAARQILHFLRQVQPGDRVAIYSLEHNGFRVLHDFTRDASDLVERLANWKGEIPATEPGKQADLGTDLAEVLQGHDGQHLWSQFSGDAEIHDAQGTLRGLEAITRRLEGIPGRKNLIWISNGFPEVEWGNLAVTAAPGFHDPRGPELAPLMSGQYGLRRGSGGEIHDAFGSGASHSNELDAAMRLVSQANVAIYPVEARGLSVGGGVYQQATQAEMLAIARKTGGRAFVNNNDVDGSIRTAVADSRVSYTLGFYPDSNRTDGKFHNITIKVPGRRDVTLRYRSGYVNDAFAPSDLGRRAHDLDQAFWSPLDANAIPLTGTADRLADGRAKIAISISVASLDLVPEQGKRRGEVDVLILQRNETGDVFGRVNETIQMNFRDATYAKLLTSGVPYSRVIEVHPRTTVIRVVVRDSTTGNLGSLTIPANAMKR